MGSSPINASPRRAGRPLVTQLAGSSPPGGGEVAKSLFTSQQKLLAKEITSVGEFANLRAQLGELARRDGKDGFLSLALYLANFARHAKDDEKVSPLVRQLPWTH
jgi:hypothetical protein